MATIEDEDERLICDHCPNPVEPDSPAVCQGCGRWYCEECGRTRLCGGLCTWCEWSDMDGITV